jgi:hypothetical protein
LALEGDSTISRLAAMDSVAEVRSRLVRQSGKADDHK